MKRIITLLLILSLLMTFASCGEGSENESKPTEVSAETSVEASAADESSEEESMAVPDENAKKIWKDEYADAEASLSSAEDIYNADYYFNGAKTDDYSVSPADGDGKFVFRGLENSRFVNVADGYMFTVPSNDVKLDLSLAEYRSQVITDKSVITVSCEDQNPYGNTPDGWNTYLTEWITVKLDSIDFLSANNIMRTSQPETTTDLIEGYEVIIHNVFIKLSTKIEYPYYNIAIIRKNGEYVKFNLVVMKSTEKSTDSFKKMLKSFAFFDGEGKSVNHGGQHEVIIPEIWNDETRAYYDKLMNQTDVDWGFFYEGNKQEYIDWMASEKGIDYKPEIFMTYYHIGWYNTMTYLDLDFLNANAGGNGFDDKPVLNLTYQFTTTNNDISGFTPMFDIMRGKYDDHFRRLAQDIKKYGKPVIFRLNNEMNTDWTSYCGVVTLLDPDIYRVCWQRLYNIFMEEGVDNTIWVFNPITITCPYCDWGEYECYYPGDEYCQMLGLTYYENANNASLESFKAIYTKTYNKYKNSFINFPWIIGEFACGCGGEKMYDWGKRGYVDTTLARNAKSQASWCREMFKCFADNQSEANVFCRNIKVAVWFSANDYVSVGGKNCVTNYLKLDERLADTLAVFREWLPKLHHND